MQSTAEQKYELTNYELRMGDRKPMDDVVALLLKRGATLAVAESCTGGRVVAAFTERAGASDYLLGGVVAYSNDVKTGVLGVAPDDIAVHGAVSREVAEQMATGVRRITGADYSVSTTGIAGPGGGSAEKPVGTVWVAICRNTRSETGEENTSSDVVTSRLFGFDGSRARIMQQAVAAAIEMLYNSL